MNPTKYLTPEEHASLQALLARHKTRDSVLIQLALATGARASEILAISEKDLSPAKGTVFIKGLKKSRDRSIPLKKELFQQLYLLASTHPTKKPFPISYERLVQIWHEWRPGPKKFHSLRHTMAIELYRRTKDIKLVQLVLGHKSLMSTAVYTDFVYAEDEMRKLLIK